MPFKYRHAVASPVQKKRRRETCRPASDHRNRFSGPDFRRMRHNKAFGKCSVDNRTLIFFCRHRICIHIAGAGRLTQCRTYPGGKLRETVRLLKPFVGLPVLLVVYQIIEFRNQII